MTEEPGGTTHRLLLVEDDVVIRDTVRIALDRYGFATTVAADGLTGLELFREQRSRRRRVRWPPAG
ncbi:response regulator transcription factor [Streptomyces sp. NRRL F-2580]|uniref:response regulator transcription factor n=1 Tax=Streptomyces sp. NRRL F-2580 TaxID=1463841 RepID=UPI0004C9A828